MTSANSCWLITVSSPRTILSGEDRFTSNDLMRALNSGLVEGPEAMRIWQALVMTVPRTGRYEESRQGYDASDAETDTDESVSPEEESDLLSNSSSAAGTAESASKEPALSDDEERAASSTKSVTALYTRLPHYDQDRAHGNLANFATKPDVRTVRMPRPNRHNEGFLVLYRRTHAIILGEGGQTLA
jgi:hypothetical protein